MLQTETAHIGEWTVHIAEITERMSRNRYAVFFRAEIHRNNKIVEITQRRSSRSQATRDGELRAMRLRLLERAEVTP